MPRRPARPLARRSHGALVAFLALIACVPLGACNRTPRLIPAGADSTLTVSPDSIVVFMRQAVRLWDEDRLEDAAFLTAAVMHADLRSRPPDTWLARSSSLLDSLNIGSETVEAECAVVVNLFSRADPTGPSWPFVFWCVGDTLQHQALEGRGMRLMNVVVRGVSEPDSDQVLAVLYGRHGPGGDQPVLFAWKRSPGGWSMVQTLGPDSLGGTGTGQFESFGGATDLVTTTYRTAEGFQECPACPHLHRERRFRWQDGAFRIVSESLTQTPYAAFVQFVQALQSADYVGAMTHASDRDVLEQAVHFGWARSLEPWRAAPGTQDRATEMVMFHGQRDAYRVWFESFGERWVLTSIDTTTRGIVAP
jgi:hypothetical protein